MKFHILNCQINPNENWNKRLICFFFTFSLFFINPLNLSGNRMEMSQYMCSHIIKECYYNVTCVLLHWSHFWNADYVFYVCKGSVKGIFLHDNFLFWIEKFFKYLFKSNRSITQAQMVIFNKKNFKNLLYLDWLLSTWAFFMHVIQIFTPNQIHFSIFVSQGQPHNKIHHSNIESINYPSNNPTRNTHHKKLCLL